MYATKKRKRIMKQLKSTLTGVQEVSKSNPSKRHRERLNSELDHLANLLPYEQGIISKLDKLSVLRLAVNYLRTKSYFQAAIYDKSLQDHHHHHHMFARSSYNRPIGNQEAPGKVKGGEVTTTTSDPTCIARAEDILQALNGFLLVVTCDGEVFFASETVEQYLGFHQSDIIHQSIMELIHSEDREQFKLQLFARPTLNLAEMTSDHVNAFNQQFRRFTVRFRCLLDNASGFITLEITGRLRVLHGQNLKSSSSKTLALFALCSPLGVLPSSEVQGHELTFKSKHKMDLSPITMDPRGKAIFGYTERELSEKKGYDLIHYDDSAYYAAAHQELIKTGSSGLIAYRLLSKDQRWIWLQTSSKVVYKNSKPDCINCVHRQLTSDEGNDLLGKRGSEFKLPYALIYDLGRPCGEAPRLTNENPSNHQKFSFRSNLPDVTEPDSAKGDPISTSGGPIVFEDASRKRTDKSSNQCSSTFNERKVISEAHSLIGKGSARSKPSRTQKKVREHLKEYLQAGRRRKTPYREIAKSYSRQEDSSKPKPSNKSAVGLVSEGQVLNDCRSAIEKINFRKDFEQGVYEQLAGSFCEATCGLPERTQPVHDDSFDFNRSSLQNDELLYYGQSHYYNYYYNYQRYQNNCPTVKDLSEDLTTFCDYQNTLTDCSRYPQIQPSLNDSLLVREMPQVSTTVPIAGYLDSSGESSNKVHSAYVSNFQNSRFPHHLNHQSVDNWKRGSSEFVQEQTRPDEKNVDQTTFHSSNNYVNKSFPRNSNHHIRHHDQYAVDLARQLSSRQSLFPIGQDSGSSVYSLEISETSLQVDTLTNFISMTSVHQNQLQERISPEGEPRPAKEPSNLPFGSFHWYPGDHVIGFDRSTFNSSSSQHDDNNNSSSNNNNINNKAAYNHDVNESVGNYQTQVSHHLHRRGQNYTSLLNSPGLEQRDLNMEFTEVSSNSDPNYDQNCHQRIGQGRTTTDSLHQQQCSDDYLLSLTSPSHESKTLRVLGCAIQTSKEQNGSYGKGRLTAIGYNGQEKDSLAGGFSSIGPNYSLTNGSYNTSLAGIKAHESGLYETVRNQDAGLKVYQISDIGSASVLHNHRSVIRLNGRCSQPQQVQAVPVIRAPSIGGNFEL